MPGYSPYGSYIGAGGGASGGAGGGWLSTLGAWAKDNPELVAQLVGIVGGAATNATARKGDIRFKRQPETPEEIAYRRYAEQLAGMHGTPGPTAAYLGPQIHNAIQNLNANSGAYQGLNMLDVATGKEIPRAPVVSTPMDYSTLPQPWVNPAASLGGPGSLGAPSVPGAPGAPPAPPEITKIKGKKKTNVVAKGILKGLVGGVVTGGGVTGGIVGAVTGGLAGRKKNELAWKQGHEAYNQWLAMYGNSFTDATGKPVKAPQNLTEYNAWYLGKYGKMPPVGGP